MQIYLQVVHNHEKAETIQMGKAKHIFTQKFNNLGNIAVFFQLWPFSSQKVGIQLSKLEDKA